MEIKITTEIEQEIRRIVREEMSAATANTSVAIDKYISSSLHRSMREHAARN